MENGDLATWTEHSLIVVLEGVIVTIPPDSVTGRIKKTYTPAPLEDWVWSKTAIKQINTKAQQNQSISVVTFISEQVADEAAGWFSKYHVAVSETYHADFDFFCESLVWSRGLDRVVDSDMARINRYGQLGYMTEPGGYF